LLAAFQDLYPRKFKRYVDPFLGGGAVFFDVKATGAVLGDANAELIRTFQAVKADVDGVIAALARHERDHDRAHFYEVREQEPGRLASDAERAARLIYLNRTCFNGLYRVNSRGLFNVPMGSYDRPRILDEQGLRLASAALRAATLTVGDFRRVLRRARASDFVYLDPPYQPVSATANFRSYTNQPFDEDDQRELAEEYARLDRMGCQVMLSNSNTPLVQKLYAAYDVRTVPARRNINARGDRRGPVFEVVVRNLKRWSA
jgi:DNA adenine methylase